MIIKLASRATFIIFIIFSFNLALAEERGNICLSNTCVGDKIDSVVNSEKWSTVKTLQGEGYQSDMDWFHSQQQYEPQDLLKGPSDVVSKLTHYMNLASLGVGEIHLDKAGLELLSEVNAVCFPVVFTASYESDGGSNSTVRLKSIPSSSKGDKQTILVVSVERKYSAKNKIEARSFEAALKNKYPGLALGYDAKKNPNWSYRVRNSTDIVLIGNDISIIPQEIIKANYADLLYKKTECSSKVSID